MRALITGFAGFAGSHLADHLLAATDWQVYGTALDPSDVPGWCDPRVTVLGGDLRDPGCAGTVVAGAQPDVVFHLAGQAFVPAAWSDPWGTFETNVRMQLNLLQALMELPSGGVTIRVVVVTSNEVYGAVPPEQLPIDETAPLAPINPYATSKAAQDLLAGQYARTPGLDVVTVRPFNHIGPRQDDRFVVSNFARQVAEIEAGLRPPVLRVGDLSAERDFTDVRDMVRGYHAAVERGVAGAVYNLGSGTAYPIAEVLTRLKECAAVPFVVEPDPERMRPSDIPKTLCDNRKAAVELGWWPEIPFPQTIADVLADWRARIAAGTGAARMAAA